MTESCCDTPGSVCGGASSIEGEARFRQIIGMIARQCCLGEVLHAICYYLAGDRGHQTIAFFLTDGDQWTLAAADGPAPRTGQELALPDPAALSESLFERDAFTAGKPMWPSGMGWARHLFSGPGELLGLVVGLTRQSLPSDRNDPMRLEAACTLAALAIEQRNLLAELAFQTSANTRAIFSEHSERAERSMQRITQMIAGQSEPAEILAALCRYDDETQQKQQLVFFLIDGEEWKLAASGDLTGQASGALASLDPASLSEALVQAGTDQTELPFDHGWARHVYSGTGELLGMLVGFTDTPGLPGGLEAVRIESICRLGALALEQHNLVEELAFRAGHDMLTGLHNRAHFDRVLNWTLQEGRRMDRRPALLQINLDRFRLVNDVLGHATGDRLLYEVGQRLQASTRTGDVIARLDGDEFAILLADVPAIEDAGATAGRLFRSLAPPFSVDGHELFVGASIGIARAVAESTPESFEREACLALHHAKKSGKARFVYFHPSMEATPPERLEMEKRLRFALERDEMLVYYQPQVDLLSGRVSGAEALMRWRPQDLGLVSPAVFLPILEETGLIAEFGRWILFQACRQGREWIEKTGLRLRIGVNVSAYQLSLPGFVQDVQQALLESGFPPELLELELTESAIVGNLAMASRTFNNLRTSAGIHFAVDDFGTGQSSLSYLHQLPFQRLKIDQSFIRRISDDQDADPLVEGILRMAEDLGMQAIAEGVETVHQLRLLQSLRCAEVQGFLFSRPLPPTEFVEYCHRFSTGSPLSQGADTLSPAEAKGGVDRRRAPISGSK